MDPLTVYKTYLGIKSHFQQDSYDFSKYGAMKAKSSTFLKRKDKYFFEKLATKYKDAEIIDMFISNFMESDSLWIGDLFTDEKQKIWIDYKKRKESLEYRFHQDIGRLCEYIECNDKKFNDLFIVNSSEHPIILKLTISKFICPETYCILDSLLNYSRVFHSKLAGDHFYEIHGKKLSKFAVFLNLNESNKKIYKKMVTEAISVRSIT